ncbi:uncharacterized protein LOC125877332 [Solanum stenotomum]|uniref:uncharacterized protein LOC125877332 n=1 Tax=Solanum stenotomum TaxID=172797 RepID=UPI0020D018AD|nr:uncharacterized protein LOC125877332 [Solanum stenotomum]
MVADSRAKMSKFISGVSEILVNKCQTTMFIHDMDISHLMVHAQQIDEEKLKEKLKEVKRDKIGDGNFSNARVSNLKPQGRNDSGSSLPMSNCTKCGRKHKGKYLLDTDGCGKSGHKMRDCSILTDRGRKGKQAPRSGSNSNAPKQNRFYALQT